MFHLFIFWVTDPFRFGDWAVPLQWPCKQVHPQLKAEVHTFLLTLPPRLWPQILEKFLCFVGMVLPTFPYGWESFQVDIESDFVQAG